MTNIEKVLKEDDKLKTLLDNNIQLKHIKIKELNY